MSVKRQIWSYNDQKVGCNLFSAWRNLSSLISNLLERFLVPQHVLKLHTIKRESCCSVALLSLQLVMQLIILPLHKQSAWIPSPSPGSQPVLQLQLYIFIGHFSFMHYHTHIGLTCDKNIPELFHSCYCTCHVTWPFPDSYVPPFTFISFLSIKAKSIQHLISIKSKEE